VSQIKDYSPQNFRKQIIAKRASQNEELINPLLHKYDKPEDYILVKKKKDSVSTTSFV
jgi:hypothetical protein